MTGQVVEPSRLGVRFELGGREVTARFDTTGPLGGQITFRQGEETLHDAPFPVKLAWHRHSCLCWVSAARDVPARAVHSPYRCSLSSSSVNPPKPPACAGPRNTALMNSRFNPSMYPR